jgi:hypothetical protein
MAGRGDRGTAPRLVPGTTVRVGFRGAKRAKTGANREDGRLVVLSRRGRDDVWLKTLTTSNHGTEPRLSQRLTEIRHGVLRRDNFLG